MKRWGKNALVWLLCVAMAFPQLSLPAYAKEAETVSKVEAAVENETVTKEAAEQEADTQVEAKDAEVADKEEKDMSSDESDKSDLPKKEAEEVSKEDATDDGKESSEKKDASSKEDPTSGEDETALDEDDTSLDSEEALEDEEELTADLEEALDEEALTVEEDEADEEEDAFVKEIKEYEPHIFFSELPHNSRYINIAIVRDEFVDEAEDAGYTMDSIDIYRAPSSDDEYVKVHTIEDLSDPYTIRDNTAAIDDGDYFGTYYTEYEGYEWCDEDTLSFAKSFYCYKVIAHFVKNSEAGKDTGADKGTEDDKDGETGDGGETGEGDETGDGDETGEGDEEGKDAGEIYSADSNILDRNGMFVFNIYKEDNWWPIYRNRWIQYAFAADENKERVTELNLHVGETGPKLHLAKKFADGKVLHTGDVVDDVNCFDGRESLKIFQENKYGLPEEVWREEENEYFSIVGGSIYCFKEIGEEERPYYIGVCTDNENDCYEILIPIKIDPAEEGVDYDEGREAPTDVCNTVEELKQAALDQATKFDFLKPYYVYYNPDNFEEDFGGSLNQMRAIVDTDAGNNFYDINKWRDGKPKEGDYLYYETMGNIYSDADIYWYGGKAYPRLKIEVHYPAMISDTRQDEAQVDKIVEDLFKEGGALYSAKTGSAASRLEKIYNYMKNISWGNALQEPLYYTAWAAATMGTASCQGQAVYFYRLAREAGVPVRVIGVTGDEKVGAGIKAHTFCIARVEGKWYVIDPSNKNKGSAFLKGSKSSGYDPRFFYDMYRDSSEFLTNFAINDTDYVPNQVYGIRLEVEKTDEMIVLEDGTIVLDANLVKEKDYKFTVEAKEVFEDKSEAELSVGLDWKSADTKLAAVSFDKVKKISTVTIPRGAYGEVELTAYAADKGKAHDSIKVQVRNYAPRLSESSITLNPLLAGGVEVGLYPSYGMEVQSATLIDGGSSAAQSADGLTIEKATEEGDTYYIKATKAGLANGTRNIKIQVEAGPEDDAKTYEIPISVKLVSVVPAVTVTQKSKFNTFYSDDENAFANIAVAAKENVVTGVSLKGADASPFALAWDEEAQMATLTWNHENAAWKDGTVKVGNSVTVLVSLEGYSQPIEKALKLSMVNVQPKLALRNTSATYNPLLDANDENEHQVTAIICDKQSQMPINLLEKRDEEPCYEASVSSQNVVDGIEEEVELGENGAVILTMNLNDKRLFVKDAEKGTTANSAAVTISLKHENWRTPINFNYKITLKETKLVAKLKNNKLILNSVFAGADAKSETKLTMNGNYLSGGGKLAITDAVIVPDCKETDGSGNPTAAWTNAQKIKLSFDDEKNCIVAQIKDANDAPPKGTYKYKITPVVKAGGENVGMDALALSVQITNAEPKLSIQNAALRKNSIFAGADSFAKTSIVLNKADLAQESDVELLLDPTAAYPETDKSGKPNGQYIEANKMEFTFEDGILTVDFVDSDDLPADGTYSFALNPVVHIADGKDIVLKQTNIKVKVDSVCPSADKIADVLVNTNLTNPTGVVSVKLANNKDPLLMSLTDGSQSMESLLCDDEKELVTAETKADVIAEAEKLQVVYSAGKITAKITGDSIKVGKYKFKFAPDYEDATRSGAEKLFTVVVTDKTPTATVSAKGKIDVRCREEGITYTVTKLNNISDAILVSEDSVEIVGEYAEYFPIKEVGRNEKGQLTVLVVPKKDTWFLSFLQLDITLQLKLLANEGDTVETAKQKIKLTQSAVKLSTSNKGTLTMYQSGMVGREHIISLTVDSPSGAGVGDVQISPTTSAKLLEMLGPDYNNLEFFDKSPDGKTAYITLKPCKALGEKAGTTYDLKLDVFPEGSFGDSPWMQVTVKVKIQR